MIFTFNRTKQHKMQLDAKLMTNNQENAHERGLKGLLMKMRWSLVRPHKLQMTARNNTVVLTASNKQHQVATNQLPTVITS